jgi:hypothetical protein
MGYRESAPVTRRAANLAVFARRPRAHTLPRCPWAPELRLGPYELRRQARRRYGMGECGGARRRANSIVTVAIKVHKRADLAADHADRPRTGIEREALAQSRASAIRTSAPLSYDVGRLEGGRPSSTVMEAPSEGDRDARGAPPPPAPLRSTLAPAHRDRGLRSALDAAHRQGVVTAT